jgi:hypothetical protein
MRQMIWPGPHSTGRFRNVHAFREEVGSIRFSGTAAIVTPEVRVEPP